MNCEIELTALKQQEEIDISENTCKELTEEMVNSAERIIVMIPEEMYPDFLAKRKDLIKWEIENDFSEKLIGEIKEKVLGLN